MILSGLATHRSKPDNTQETVPKITIYDLAKLTGASASTVSACLNGTWRGRRIKEDTAREIQRIADQNGYRTNLQARGLRRSRSGLAGLILPIYNDRFFSSLAQSFDDEARARGLCPITVSTNRDPAEEQQTVETLISYAVDSVFTAGASDPDAISRLCDRAGLANINIDLPGSVASSVISDNRGGAAALAEAMFDAHDGPDAALAGRIYLVGGEPADFATRERIAGFEDVVRRRTGSCDAAQIRATGYDPVKSAHEAEILFADPDRAPRALLVNSTLAFEGVLGVLAELPAAQIQALVVGCYDYDPLTRYLKVPIISVRQDVNGLIREAFRLLDAPPAEPAIVRVPPTLLASRDDAPRVSATRP